MLSDAEKKAINDLNFIIVTDVYDNEVRIDKTKTINEYNESVGIVLNLIKKQSKEIEELNKSDASKEQSSMKYYNLYKELVDKIKAKIEELENEKEKYFEKQVIQHEIEVLQSLLEKE